MLTKYLKTGFTWYLKSDFLIGLFISLRHGPTWRPFGWSRERKSNDMAARALFSSMAECFYIYFEISELKAVKKKCIRVSSAMSRQLFFCLRAVLFVERKGKQRSHVFRLKYRQYDNRWIIPKGNDLFQTIIFNMCIYLAYFSRGIEYFSNKKYCFYQRYWDWKTSKWASTLLSKTKKYPLKINKIELLCTLGYLETLH